VKEKLGMERFTISLDAHLDHEHIKPKN